MSIISTHSYYLLEGDKEPKIMRPRAPLGLLYVSSYLNKIEKHVYESKSFEYLYLQKKRTAKKYFHQGNLFSLG
jgi:hypothetical protein